MKTLINLDNCLPDYFRGHHNQTLAIPYDCFMTVEQVLDDIESEINQIEIAQEYSGYSYDEADEAIKRARADNKSVLHKLYMPDCEYSFDEEHENYIGEYGDSCYAYFTLVDENTGE